MATDFSKELENFRKRCLELEEKSKKDEIRCLMLENEVESLKRKNQELEGKIKIIQQVIVDPTYVKNESEGLFEIMVENKVLECEKQKAETELCVLKEKVKELESNLKGMNAVSTGTENVLHSQVRKRLLFEEDGCTDKHMFPSTPGVPQSRFHGIIDISDDEVNFNEYPKAKTESGSRKHDDLIESIDEKHTDESKFHSSGTRSAKRKRGAKIITSDDENSYDDNMHKMKYNSHVMKNSEEEVVENFSRRPLTRLRRLETKNEKDKSDFDLSKSIGLNDDDEDEDDDVDESESEGESLGGFIVDSSESVSICDSNSRDSTDESEDVLNEYKATLEKIGRKKSLNLKWDLEGDMLSDLAKDPELCMRAVCALYRQQTADEKACKVTIHHNERGFSQPDAWRASELAEFLTDRDPKGDLKKTVEELKAYDSEGVELCMKLAAKYSKQLFVIYQNKEDPYFRPQ